MGSLEITCVTLRENTERPEIVDVGANVLAGADSARILNGAGQMIGNSDQWTNPFGNGNAAKWIINILI